jgi:hypothetical protein
LKQRFDDLPEPFGSEPGSLLQIHLPGELLDPRFAPSHHQGHESHTKGEQYDQAQTEPHGTPDGFNLLAKSLRPPESRQHKHLAGVHVTDEATCGVRVTPAG